MHTTQSVDLGMQRSELCRWPYATWTDPGVVVGACSPLQIGADSGKLLPTQHTLSSFELLRVDRSSLLRAAAQLPIISRTC